MEEHIFDWFVNIFYYEGDLVKTFLALFGFGFLIVFLLEAFYIIKQGALSVKG